MNDLDTVGRRHAQIVISSVADIPRPPVDTLVSKPARASRGGLLVTAVGAVVVVGIFAMLVARSSDAPPATNPEPPPASSSVATSSTTLESTSLASFDVSSFIEAKLDGAFVEPAAGEVGVIALVPVESEKEFDTRLNSVTLSELESYTYVPAIDLAAAVERFAEEHGTDPIEGDWVAYGLVPQFWDSPISDWIDKLTDVAGVQIARVDFEPLATRIPDGWQVIADLSFGVSTGAVVQTVDAGVVVIDGVSTRLIFDDGSWVTGDPSPLGVRSSCCGDVTGLSAGDSVVLIKAGNSETWILDVETLTWHQAETPPATGYAVGRERYPLGSALIDGELVVVTAAGRYADAISTVAALNIDTGTWHELEPVPSPIAVGGVTNDGNRLVVAGTAQDANNNVIGSRNPVTYQYMAESGWEELGPIPVDGQASTVTWVDNAGLLAWNYDLQSAILDSAGRWRTIDDVPMPLSECYPRSVAVNTGAIAECGGLAWFNSATLAWHPIRTPLAARFASKPTHIIGFLDIGPDSTTLIKYGLPPKTPGN